MGPSHIQDIAIHQSTMTGAGSAFVCFSCFVNVVPFYEFFIQWASQVKCSTLCIISPANLSSFSTLHTSSHNFRTSPLLFLRQRYLLHHSGQCPVKTSNVSTLILPPPGFYQLGKSKDPASISLSMG